MMRWLSRHPVMVVATILVAAIAAGWYATVHIETVLRPRQEAARQAMIGEQIAAADGLFARRDIAAALAEYRFVLGAYGEDLSGGERGRLNDAVGRCHMALAETANADANLVAAAEALALALVDRTPEAGLAAHIDSWLRRGQAIAALAALRADKTLLAEAVGLFAEALARLPETDMAIERAAAHRLLGNAQRESSRAEPEAVSMETALAHYRASLSEVPALKHPHARAATLTEMGNAYLVLSGQGYRARSLVHAVEAFEKAARLYDIDSVPRLHAQAQLRIGDTYTLLAALGPSSRSDRAAQQQRAMRYESKAKKAYKVAQAFGLMPAWATSEEPAGAIVEDDK
jgi:hypothetical protein